MCPTIAFGLLALTSSSAPKLDPALEAKVRTRAAIVTEWASDPIVVEAVKEANARPLGMDEIERIDAKWQATRGVDEFIRGLIDHPAAVRLRELRESHPELQEAFVTDARGANVACTNKTSDFYQGDEAKFVEAFADGKGGFHLGELVRDESIQSYSITLGVPVMDGDVAIGVLDVTVNVEKLKASATP